MPNAIFVCHMVSFLPHHRLRPALVCCHHSTPSPSVAIAVRGSRIKPPQSSSSPIRCLCRLLSLSLDAVISRRRPPSFQFIARRRRHRRYLSEIDIIAIYSLPSPRLLLPAPSLVSCRASSPTPSPASTLTSG